MTALGDIGRVFCFSTPESAHMQSSLLECPILEEDWLKEVGERNGISTAPARLHGINGEHKAVPDAGPWEPAVQEMVAFQHLGDNWDGQGAQRRPKRY